MKIKDTQCMYKYNIEPFLNNHLFMQGLKFVYFSSFIFEQRVASPDAMVCRQLCALGGSEHDVTSHDALEASRNFQCPRY